MVNGAGNPSSVSRAEDGRTGASRGSADMGGPIDKSSPVPLYFQIAQNLRTAIEDGVLGPGDRLENEVEFSERLGVSRPTVRQAIQHLVHDGLIARRRGVGTVVVSRPFQRPLAFSSLYDDLSAAGRSPTTEVLSVTEVPSDENVAVALAIRVGKPALRIERLRSAEGLPLACMCNYVAPSLLHGVDVPMVLAKRGFYEMLRDRGVKFASADEVIGAREATSREARLLGVPRRSTVLTMSRLARDLRGQPIEYGIHAYLADRYSFRIALGASISHRGGIQ